MSDPNAQLRTMKALSIRQPWAWLILQGSKDIENRSRRTHYRGELLVHAGKSMDQYGRDTAEALVSMARKAGWEFDPEHELVRGAITGRVTVIDCVETHDSEWFEGPFGYVLDPNSAQFLKKPIPMNGRLGFFDVEIMLSDRDFLPHGDLPGWS